MADEWYYSVGGKQGGPASKDELKQLADDGRLAPHDVVWRQGMSAWLPAAKLRGLFPEPDTTTAVSAANQPPPPSQGAMGGDLLEASTDISADGNQGFYRFGERRLSMLPRDCYRGLWVTFIAQCGAILMPNPGLVVVVGCISFLLTAVTLCICLYTFEISARVWGSKKSGRAVAGLISSTLVAIYCTLSLMCSCSIATTMLKGLNTLDAIFGGHGGGRGPF